MTTLVVAAYQGELDQLAAQLPVAVAARVALRAVGVGLVEAAAGTERALRDGPERLVLVGLAARLGASPLGLGELAVVRRAHLLARPPEYTPAAMASRADADGELAFAYARALGLPLVEALSPLGVTYSDEEAARLGQGPAQLEQLECFAVLQVAARARVPAVGLFAVASSAGARCAAEWRAHHAAASAAVMEALARALA